MTGDDARDAERGGPEGEASLAPRDALPEPARRAEPADPADATGTAAATERPPRRTDRGRLRAFAGAVADRLIETAPRIPVRGLATLREQFPGKGPEEIADALIAGALRGSATVGAGVGAAAMLPVPPAMPTELATEIVGVASVEIKLLAELHEVYGLRPPGGPARRGSAYLSSWIHQRGIDPLSPATVNAALGGQLRRELRQHLLKRSLRNLPNLTPFMIGAVVGAAMNRRDTRKLAERVRADLRERQVPWDVLPHGAQSPEPPAAPSADTSR
ncbi:hypothetical protein GCM10023347_12200 [Streptomyces chumphonensis]|uniref:hypothetical protein n=1 Tax=Streptomyces chumphonensis TaxID=1214925 RepID=UPI00296565C6|nr:hypothetical protein [Streptomyces chumphonensis]